MRVRIYNKQQSKHLYALSSSDAHRVKFIGVLGLLSLVLLLIGFYYFVSQSLLVAIVCVPFFVIVALYHLINYWLMSLYQGFDAKKHRKKVAQFKKRKKQPRIAVFIPAAGESVDIVERTAIKAAAIRYSNFEVFLLDDSKDAIYQDMAKKIGVTYMRRGNPGHHKKAGNMNAAISKIKGFSHVLVLDADFVPRKEILEELAPYAKPDVGVVQSPQHFDLSDKVYQRSKIEYGAGMIQRDFYRITQVARNRLGGAICVGTNALYSVAALKKVGGFEGVGRPEWGHSEDVHTGLKMLNSLNKSGKRFRIEYIPVQLAVGMCPDDHLSFYKQQNRWATGSMQLIFSKKTLFSRMLSIPQKITYFSNSVYYFYTIGLLFAPIQLLILLLSPREFDWTYTLLFMPMLFVTYVLTPFLLRQKVEPVAASVVVISNAYTFAQALWLLMIRRPLGWEATGAKSSKPKRHVQFFAMKLLSSGSFILVYLATLGVLVLNYDFGFNPSTFITFVFLASFLGHCIYLHYLFKGSLAKKLYRDMHSYGYALLALLILGTVVVGFSNSSEYDIKQENFTAVRLIDENKLTTKAEPPNPEVESVNDSAAKKPSPQTDRTYNILAMKGESQSKIATKIVSMFRADKSIDDATAGKLQDKLMHEMGYRDDINSGIKYEFKQSKLEDMINNEARVSLDESSFWDSYAIKVGLQG